MEECTYKPLRENSSYLIYSDGRLFSKKTNSFLKGMVDGSGYHCYLVTINGKPKFLRTNRLVAKYFVLNPNPKECIIVNHIDGNKLNNNAKNLEWVSYSENIKKYYSNNKVKYQKAIYSEDNEEEFWIPIKGYSRYEVSSLGRVRVKKTKRIMRYDEKTKYARLILLDDQGNRKHVLGHTLVYCNFNNDFDLDNYVIDHIDANPRNNKVENLQK